MPPEIQEASPNKKLLIQFGVFLLIIGGLVTLGQFVPVLEVLSNLQKAVESHGWRAGLVYPFVFAGCNLLLLPGGVVSMGAGFFFGLWWGFLIVVTGNLISAAAAFFIARKLGRARLERFMERYESLRNLDHLINRHGWKIIVLTQLNPLFPVSLLVYLYGLSRISFGSCLLWVNVGRLPGMFLYVYLGTLGQLGLNLLQTSRSPTRSEALLWGGGLAVALVTTLLLAHLSWKMWREASAMNSQD